MSTELINRITVKKDGVYLSSHSSNDTAPFHSWRCKSLSEIYAAEGQAGAHHQTAEEGAQAVPKPAAEQGTEESGGDTVAQQHRGGAVAAAGGREAVHHGPGLVQGRYGKADLAA